MSSGYVVSVFVPDRTQDDAFLEFARSQDMPLDLVTDRVKGFARCSNVSRYDWDDVYGGPHQTLGSLRKHLELSAPNYDSQVRKYRRRGWKKEKIDRAINKLKAEEPLREEEKKKGIEEILKESESECQFWIGLISQIIQSGVSSWVGLAVQGTGKHAKRLLDAPENAVEVPLAELNQELLLNMQPAQILVFS